MSSCCSSPGNDEIFTEGMARRTAWRYRRFGLLRQERRVVDTLSAHGVAGTTVVEIGGGVGQLLLALLDRGADAAVNLELSPNYEVAADRLAAESGHRDSTTRLLGDAAHLDEPLPPADVAILYRVVCCTDDWRGMLDAALATVPRVLAVTLPHAGWVPRTVGRVGNALLGVNSTSFRMRHHDPAEVVGHLTDAGYEVTSDAAALFWRTVVLTAGGRSHDTRGTTLTRGRARQDGQVEDARHDS